VTSLIPSSYCLFFHAAPPTYTSSLSLHDALPICVLLLPRDLKAGERRPVVVCQHGLEGLPADTITDDPKASGYSAYKGFAGRLRSEEHTSELQSRFDLVCRLLLEKKKKAKNSRQL